MEAYDVVVIGSGPGGYVAAVKATQLGAKTALVEKDRIGGTCLNRGCIPTKTLIEGVSFLDSVERGRRFGLLVNEVSVDYSRLQARKNEVVAALVDDVRNLLINDGVEIIAGTAHLASPASVDVYSPNGHVEHVESKRIILATGSLPLQLRIPGVESPRVLSTDEALALPALPTTLAIIGGGVVGVEMATIFARLGVRVTIVEMMPQILPGEDADVATALAKSLKKKGIEIITGAKVQEIVEAPPEVRLITDSGAGNRTVAAEYALMAAGRKPNLSGLRHGEVGVEVASGAITVNSRMQTSVPNIYAVGDAVGGIMLAHVASREGIVAAANALGHESTMDYRAIPRCVYSSPEIGAVGLTEKQAVDEGYEVGIGRFEFLANGRAKASGETEGFAKVIVDRQYGEVLGVHVFGPHATELIAQAALAIKAELAIEVVTANVAAHPTYSEAIAEAFEDVFGRAIHVPRWGM